MKRIPTILSTEVFPHQDAASNSGHVSPLLLCWRWKNSPASVAVSSMSATVITVFLAMFQPACRLVPALPFPHLLPVFQEDFTLHLLFTHRPSRQEAPELFWPKTLSSFRRWYRVARPGLALATLFSFSTARVFAAGNGTVDFSQLNTLLTSLVAEHKIIVVTLFVLLGVAGLVMTIWQRTRVPGMLMAGICLVCAVLVGILVNSVNSMTGGDVTY